ncbi:MAG TPA: hypothetical protein PLM24_03350 [Methanothrix sp.]|nr:hypothetical protein [Methanothrix sp.]HPJ83287.1 hypothetical protein [Methanothrix sp.]HPR66152.1 hypothetical protein [Methanothrix sp.]
MKPSTFDVARRRTKITVFRVGRIWTFKHFFGEKEIFKELADHYSRDNYRFEFLTEHERDEAFKKLKNRGFDFHVIEDLAGYVVSLDRSSKYAPVLKNSIENVETQNERIFLMKDLVSVEEALGFGAEIYDGIIPF